MSCSVLEIFSSVKVVISMESHSKKGFLTKLILNLMVKYYLIMHHYYNTTHHCTINYTHNKIIYCSIDFMIFLCNAVSNKF